LAPDYVIRKKGYSVTATEYERNAKECTPLWKLKDFIEIKIQMGEI
jgi:hypothetical protein